MPPDAIGVTDLADLSDSLKRAVAPLGDFASVFATATDDDVTGALMDGFAEAQLDGWFTQYWGGQKDLDVTTGVVTPDLSNAQGALVVIYAAFRLTTARLLNLKNRVKYSARGADYETEQASNVLTTLLKQFADRKQALYQKALYSGANAAFSMADGYFFAATQRYYTPLGSSEDNYMPYPIGG